MCKGPQKRTSWPAEHRKQVTRAKCPEGEEQWEQSQQGKEGDEAGLGACGQKCGLFSMNGGKPSEDCKHLRT